MHQLHSGHEYTQAHTSDRPTGFEQLVLLYIQTSSTHTSSVNVCVCVCVCLCVLIVIIQNTVCERLKGKLAYTSISIIMCMPV